MLYSDASLQGMVFLEILSVLEQQLSIIQSYCSIVILGVNMQDCVDQNWPMRKKEVNDWMIGMAEKTIITGSKDECVLLD